MPAGVAPPAGSVTIGTAADPQMVVDAEPPGTTFWIAAGAHLGFSVHPKTGDQFRGAPGAILEGGHTVISAFSVTARSMADDVAITGSAADSPLTITGYGKDPRSQVGAIQPSTTAAGVGVIRANGWKVEDVSVTDDASRGISLSDGMTIEDSQVEDNGRLGIGGGGSDITISHDVISDNGIDASDPGFEAGGIKTVGDDVTVSDDVLRGNGTSGVWTDGGSTGVTISNSTFQDDGVGVHVEISRNVSVDANSVSGCAMQAVLVVASYGVTIAHNEIASNHGGIIVGGVHRSGPDGINLGAIAVHDNTVNQSGVTGLTQQLLPGMTVQFDADTYVGERFTWQGARVTLAQWQAEGQERTGTSSASLDNGVG
jgi:hypothetical protein